jgi:F0F1-type ATP synthase assembly protein I
LGYAASIDPDAKKMWKSMGSTSALGLEIAIAIAIGFLGGRWLDGKLHTAPWLTWIGFAAGIGAGVKAVVRVVREYKRDYPDEPDDGPPDGQSPPP